MDDIIGFLIFVGIVAVSIIGKIKSERKAAEERKQQPSPPLTLDELPETTRRMLYGEGDIIVATPRQTAPRPEPSVPRPAAPPPPVPARQIVVERPRPVMAPQPPRVPPVRTATPPRQQLQRPQQQRRFPVQAPPAPARPHPQPSRAPGREQPVAARSEVHPAKSARSSRAPGREKLIQALHCRSGLTQAVLLREILGPPRAFDL